jgi:dUTP pyrophosphatase
MKTGTIKIYSETGEELVFNPENAGIDLRAIEGTFVLAGERAVIGTGIYVQLPPMTQIEIRSRSGLAAKYGIMVLNSPGTIDESYRGEIGVILFNTSRFDFSVKKGDRIAQAVFMPVLEPVFERVESKEELSKTERGEGGFGHSGVQ